MIGQKPNRYGAAEFRPEGLVIAGQSIVEVWEEPVQRRLAEIAKAGDQVLEIGYGLGMASARLAEIQPSYHCIIEAHPAVAAVARRRLVDRDRVHVIEDRWEIACDRFEDGCFDVIICDAYPFDDPPYNGTALSTMRFVEPIIVPASRLLRERGILGFIDFSRKLHLLEPFLLIVSAIFRNVQVEEIAVDIPTECEYAAGDSANIVLLVK